MRLRVPALGYPRREVRVERVPDGDVGFLELAVYKIYANTERRLVGVRISAMDSAELATWFQDHVARRLK